MTTTRFVHKSYETYSRDGRAIQGAVPCIRLAAANVLVVSMGASRDEVEAITDEIAAHLADRDDSDQVQAAARAMLAALKRAMDDFGSDFAGPTIEAIRLAIAQAEAAGIEPTP
jgi:hypothetical protein